MTDLEKIQRRLDRERSARKEAERLLQEKSAALYEKNTQLSALSESLEKLVAQRTAQMQKARDDALAALQVKSDFIANMSHELRTPMNGVLGVLTLLQEENLNEEQAELLAVAQSSGKHLLEVINDILDFSKIEANKISIELAPLEVRPYLDELIAPFILQAKQKNIALNCHINNDVEATLLSDKLRLTQIISNLLSNAIKFTHEGAVNLIFSKKEAGQYRIEVRDTGIGISAENINLVFTAFEQADTSITREFGGTGLGMNITKRLVDMLNGDIHIQSELGRGTSFCIDIDMEVVNNTLINKVERDDKINLGRELSLLLVEDHTVNQMIATRLLENWGFSVLLAENGAQALEIAKQQVFDVILMDLQMPVMGGIQASRLLRERSLIAENVPIIAMTAHSTEEHIKECLAAGMQDHISKPLNKEILLSVLQRHLDSNTVMSEANDEQLSATSPTLLAISIAHINIADALQRVGNDWSLLHSLIKRFLDEFLDFYAVFSQAKADDMQTYGISMLHKIKGSGGNLGFQPLYELASEAESNMLVQSKWPSNDSIMQIENMLSDIRADFVKIDPELGQEPGTTKAIKVSDKEVLAHISQAQESLKQDVFATQATLDEMLSFELNNELYKLINQAHTALMVFDTETVAQALSKARLILE
jgi:signal transduction histidine kinase/CheY-like chemotaxis protein/HPt (histidine-containing phosphotransfer) domain-containing protein